MKRRVSIRPEAQHDIREAAAWYESRERGVGIRFRNEVRTTSRRIGENALMFPAIAMVELGGHCLEAFATRCTSQSWRVQSSS